MLKQRIITAVVLVGVLSAILFGVHDRLFGLVLAAVFSVAAWEWANLGGLEGIKSRLGYAVLAAITFVSIWYVNVQANSFLYVFLALSVAGWLCALLAITKYPKWRGWCKPGLLLPLGCWVLLPCYCSLLLLKQLSPQGDLLLLVIASIAAADIGAYFSGRKFGRHKLAPSVSPGKTWEGVLGGMLASFVLAILLVYVLGYRPLPPEHFVGLVMITALVSVPGDLFESLVKRERGVKDSSTLLPGHGGILDRLDGWTAAFPVFTFCYLLLV
jgi:phosphatidate cytidylyltransferase